MNTHIVLKKIPGVNAEVGSEVDASEWRNAPLLEKQRYLKALDGVAAADGAVADVTFDQRVIAAVKQNVLEGGELAELFSHRAPMEAQASRKGKTSQS